MTASTAISAEEAVGRIRTGDTVMVGGFGLVGAPLTLIDALVEASDATDLTSFFGGGPKVWTSREGMTSALQVLLLLTVLSLAPAVLLMTTCFVRIVIVLGLLRQALGLQQSPPSQVITSIAMFMTLLIMAPVWKLFTEAVSRNGSVTTERRLMILNFIGAVILRTLLRDDQLEELVEGPAQDTRELWHAMLANGIEKLLLVPGPQSVRDAAGKEPGPAPKLNGSSRSDR